MMAAFTATGHRSKRPLYNMKAHTASCGQDPWQWRSGSEIQTEQSLSLNKVHTVTEQA